MSAMRPASVWESVFVEALAWRANRPRRDFSPRSATPTELAEWLEAAFPLDPGSDPFASVEEAAITSDLAEYGPKDAGPAPRDLVAGLVNDPEPLRSAYREKLAAWRRNQKLPAISDAQILRQRDAERALLAGFLLPMRNPSWESQWTDALFAVSALAADLGGTALRWIAAKALKLQPRDRVAYEEDQRWRVAQKTASWLARELRKGHRRSLADWAATDRPSTASWSSRWPWTT